MCNVITISSYLYRLHYDYGEETRVSSLLGVLATFTSSPAGFGLDEKVDKEQTGKKSSECDGKVGSELDLKGDSVGGESLNNRVKGESRGSEGGSGESTGSNLAQSGLGDCMI